MERPVRFSEAFEENEMTAKRKSNKKKTSSPLRNMPRAVGWRPATDAMIGIRTSAMFGPGRGPDGDHGEEQDGPRHDGCDDRRPEGRLGKGAAEVNMSQT